MTLKRILQEHISLIRHAIFRLLEIIPTAQTSPEVVDFYMQFGSKFLGKKTVLCKDTPAFIANRVGVYSILSLFHAVEEMGLDNR